MSAPLDVLKSLDELYACLAPDAAELCEQVRAQVAELIAKDEAYDLALANVMNGSDMCSFPHARERRAAAIAACKGQQP